MPIRIRILHQVTMNTYISGKVKNLDSTLNHNNANLLCFVFLASVIDVNNFRIFRTKICLRMISRKRRTCPRLIFRPRSTISTQACQLSFNQSRDVTQSL